MVDAGAAAVILTRADFWRAPKMPAALQAEASNGADVVSFTNRCEMPQRRR